MDIPLETVAMLPEEERQARFDAAWEEGHLLSLGSRFADLIINRAANDTIAALFHERIRSIVKDPDTADALCPKDHAIATKRMCLDSGYYETFNLPHVRLVDLRKQPITTVTEKGIDTTEESFEFDAIVFATGFDAMTGAIVAVDITGRDGVTLKQKWADGPVTYLGLTTVGFPNLFMITGPGSPSVLSNMAVSIEQHVDWIADRLGLDARQRLRDASSRPRPPRPAGSSTSTTAPTSRCSRRRTRGTWAPTCPASRGCSCPTSAASTGTGRRATRSSSAACSASALTGPAGEQCNDGVIRRLQPDVAIVLEMMVEMGLPPIETHVGRTRPGRSCTQMNEVRPPGPEVGEIVDGVLPGPAGDLAYRLYRPEGTGPFPLVVYFHGGGWVLGAHDSDDPFCRDLCVRSGRRRRVGRLPPRPRGRASRPPSTMRSPRCSGSPSTPSSSAGSPASSPSPGGARAATSPPSSAGWRATRAGRRSPVSCCSRRSPTAT